MMMHPAYQAVIAFLMLPANQLFGWSLLAFFLIGMCEIISLMWKEVVGVEEAEDVLSQWLGVPWTVVLALFLLVFGLVGVFIQSLVTGLSGAGLDARSAGIIAATFSLPILALSLKGMGRLFGTSRQSS